MQEQIKLAYQAKHAFLNDYVVLGESKDRFGTIRVKLKKDFSGTDKYIDLSFDEDDVQSRLNISMPNRPELKYIQSMLVAPLFFPKYEGLQSVLVIGHGGGTIAKYYSDFYKEKIKVIVDIRPKLFDISKQFFNYVPDENTSLVPSDASIFVKKARVAKDKYDIINVDIFFDGPSDIQLTHYFWDDISSILKHGGVSVTNVWRGEHMEKYNKILDNHKSVFKTVFEIANSDTMQVAMFGSNTPFEMLMHPDLYTKSIEMSGLTAVDFRTHVSNIRRLK